MKQPNTYRQRSERQGAIRTFASALRSISLRGPRILAKCAKTAILRVVIAFASLSLPGSAHRALRTSVHFPLRDRYVNERDIFFISLCWPSLYGDRAIPRRFSRNAPRRCLLYTYSRPRAFFINRSSTVAIPSKYRTRLSVVPVCEYTASEVAKSEFISIFGNVTAF